MFVCSGVCLCAFKGMCVCSGVSVSVCVCVFNVIVWVRECVQSESVDKVISAQRSACQCEEVQTSAG